jgi:undecaprenyl diphosphate synthase
MRVPAHIAIVMDGNGRWAQKRGYPRVFGHIRGCRRVREVVEKASEVGVQALTLYAFSMENWNRPQNEIDVLWKLLKKFLLRDEAALHEKNVRLEVIGDLTRLTEDVRAVLFPALERLTKNTGLRLTIALSYGGRSELVHAAQQFAKLCQEGGAHWGSLTEQSFEQFFYSKERPADVDLFIRTSGEMRLSNFLLCQSAYAELVFDPALWPDFGAQNLLAAIELFSRRERRFGRVTSVVASESPGLTPHFFPLPENEVGLKQGLA